jgi:hypothetical protein
MTIPRNPATLPEVKTGPAKAWAAGIGLTLNAFTMGNAAVQLAVEDGTLSFDEIGSVLLALSTMVTTIYAVWRVPNKPVNEPAHQYDGNI